MLAAVVWFGWPVAAQQTQPLTLAQAIETALAHHPALQTASGQLAEARARTEEARAGLGVQVNANARYSVVSTLPEIPLAPPLPSVTLGSRTSLLTTLSAQQTLFTGGRLHALVRQASNLARATEATGVRTRQQVVFQTTRAFQLLVAAQRGCGVAQQSLETANTHLRNAIVRFQAETAPRFDVLRAQVDVDTARQQVINAGVDQQVARDALLQAMGLTDGNYTAVETLLPAITLPPVEEALEQAYIRRPELRAFDFQLSAATEAITAARRARIPTLGIALNYQLTSPDTPVQTSGWTLMLQAALPLLDAGLTKARTRQTEAQRTQVLAARRALLTAVTAEVRDAYARMQAADAALEVANAQVELAQETMRIAVVRYQGGVSTAAEIADAQATLTRARQGLVTAQANLLITRAEFDFALGAPTTEATP